ncbi:MAG: hypothetical protein Faunusvirus27_5 [Faunusvirus sp.]|jgi:group I intron endonuclease|uniref:GIY-YIG domain-containing protein n=1 Tax=Faunusvirus sp. TaxID=2487766 RepID=A0A3G4ZZ71_9VIRU|nr:MAG: hypothetical protein Faunusvirus27_5 [Faunusvirus sp.]
MGDIYLLTSPSGKQYVGQTVKFARSGKKQGYLVRWNSHISEANRNINYSRVLDAAIRKHGHENFKVELLEECEEDEMNEREQYYIKTINTMSPNGYNLTEGGSNGRQSEETCQRKSISGMGKNKGNIYPKRPRKNDDENDLPKYMRKYTDARGRKGYRIVHHPKCKSKSFIAMNRTLNEKYKKCLDYLNELNKINTI